MSYSSFQLQLWRRGVGPWVSEFESLGSSTERSDREDEVHDRIQKTAKYVKSTQGLWVRKMKTGKTGHRTTNKFKYDPSCDDNIQGDPHKTVFVARLDYSTTEETLLETFSKFGSIEQFRLVKDSKTGKSRGYGFIEFCDANDAKRALRETNDKKLSVDGREVLVDRVRAGVVSSWLPRRLGGGLGQRQKGTQRFAWKLAYFGDPSRTDYGEIYRKQQLWLDHCRRSTKSFS